MNEEHVWIHTLGTLLGRLVCACLYQVRCSSPGTYITAYLPWAWWDQAFGPRVGQDEDPEPQWSPPAGLHAVQQFYCSAAAPAQPQSLMGHCMYNVIHSHHYDFQCKQCRNAAFPILRALFQHASPHPSSQVLSQTIVTNDCYETFLCQAWPQCI